MSKVHEDNAGYVGVSYEETQDPFYSYNKLSLPLSESQLSAKQPAEETFTVTVANSKFVIDGVSQASLSLAEGGIYKFDQSDSSNAGHPLRFSYTEDGTHGDGQEYTLGVTTNGTPGTAGAYTKIVVPFGLHDLYYYCSVHSGYGGFANVAKDVYKFTTGLPILKTTDAFGKTLGTGNNEDPYAANLVLAIPMNGANNGTTFTDVSNVIRGSGSAHTVSVAGNTKTVTSEFQYYGSSAAFDNSGDYLSLPDTSALHLNGEECTIEGWFYTNDAPGTGGGNAIPFFAQADVNTNSTSGTANFWSFADSGFWYFGSSTGYMTISPSNIPVGSWFHFACVVTNTTQAKMYVNGELKGEGTIGAIGSGTSRTTNLGVITSGANAKSYLNGYIQDFRMYNVAKYTTPFTTGGYGMDVLTYNGNGSTQTISGLNFQPDLIWMSARDATGYIKYIFDSVRGANKALATSHIQGDDAETTLSDGLASFNSDGFTLGSNASSNENNRSMVAWGWKAGGAPTTDNVAGAGNVPTAGSVKIDGANMTTALAGTVAATRLTANTTYGFSIVSWTVGTAPYTVAHGLNAEPYFIITKSRTGNGTNWGTYHKSTGNQSRTYLNLDLAASSGEAVWNSTTPTNSVFSLNTSGEFSGDMVAYCWSQVSGFSKFDSYSGNGSTQVITTGFKPAWIMFKRYDSNAAGADWYILDTKRFSGSQEYLLSPNNNVAETGTLADYVVLNDDGFTLQTGTTLNGTGRSYIYAAFAESAPGDAAFESLVVDQLDLKDRSGNSNNASNTGVTWQTSVSKFYGGAAEFDGNADENAASRLSVSDGLTFNSDFTIEFWAYPSTSPDHSVLFDCWQNQASGTGFYLWAHSSGAVDIVKDVNTYYLQSFMSAGSISVNAWNHIAIVRSGNVVTGYSNGSPRGNYTVSDNWTSTKGMIGSGTGNSTMKGFAGYLQDFKHYGGIAKYTSSFTPPERSVQGTARRYPSGIYVVS